MMSVQINDSVKSINSLLCTTDCSINYIMKMQFNFLLKELDLVVSPDVSTATYFEVHVLYKFINNFMK